MVLPYDHPCRASLPWEHVDAAVTSMKSAEVGACRVDPDHGGCPDTVPRRNEKNKHSPKGKSRLRLMRAAATFQRYQWYLDNARLRCGVPAGGPAGHRDMR